MCYLIHKLEASATRYTSWKLVLLGGDLHHQTAVPEVIKSLPERTDMAYPGTPIPTSCYTHSRPVHLEKDHFPPLPEVAWKVLELTTDIYVGAGDLASVISIDQTLTTRILRMANSAFFQRLHEVKTLRQASTVLGNRRIRGIVIAASLGGILYKTMHGKALWEHAVAVGLVARELSRKACPGLDAEEAFVAGLLHDVGKGLFDSQYPEKFANAVALSSFQPDVGSREAELYVLGMDHTEAGCQVAGFWGLPALLSDVIRFHHEPFSAEVSTDLCCVVNIADALCLRNGVGTLKREGLDLEAQPGFSRMRVSIEQLLELETSLFEQLGKEKAIFGFR